MNGAFRVGRCVCSGLGGMIRVLWFSLYPVGG